MGSGDGTMKVAFTMDDLPLWPQSDPPSGYTAAGIVRAIQDALAEQAITGVYAFANSWPLDRGDEYAAIMDDWVAAGHHVANHTHSHIQLRDTSAEAFIADIETAAARLAHWVAVAPLKLFRHPLCHWGETPEKLAAVNEALGSAGLTPVDVTSWVYEWTFNRAYRNALDAGDAAALAFVADSFLDFAVAQMRHDHLAAETWFGEEVIGITLGHNVPFFADIASRFFGRLVDEGVVFVPLQQALSGATQRAVGSVVSDKFLVLQQKLADAAGTPLAQIPDDQQHLFAQITEMAKGQTG